MDPQSSSPHQFDRTTLTLPVRRALQNDRVEVDRWSTTTLSGGFATAVGGIVRVWGTARDGDALFPWSLVLKDVVLNSSADVRYVIDPTHPAYRRREPLVYQSGLIDDLPGGLVAPRCYGVEERSPERYWLWLEDIDPSSVQAWSRETYTLAARHLGAFNGGYLTTRPVPDETWLNRDYLRKYLAFSNEASIVRTIEDPDTWRFSRALEAFAPSTVDRILNVWSRYPALIADANRLPQTLGHMDAHRRNLLPRVAPDGRKQTVAIDWATVGLAAVGSDAAQLAVATLVFDDVEGMGARDFIDLIFENYLNGLRDAGWSGPRVAVRSGFAAFGVVRWAINVVGLVLENLATHDPNVQAGTEAWLGRPIDKILAQWIDLVYALVDLADET